MRINILSFLIISILFVSCGGDVPYTKGAPPASDAFLIQLGESVGVVRVGESRDSITQSLGTPILSDSMTDGIIDHWAIPVDTSGKALVTFSVKNYNGDGSDHFQVAKILVADSNYRTSEGVGPADSIWNLSRVFIVRPAGDFKMNNIKYTIFGTQRGMSFIINPDGVAQSVIVYNPKVDIDSAAYIPFYIKD